MAGPAGANNFAAAPALVLEADGTLVCAATDMTTKTKETGEPAGSGTTRNASDAAALTQTAWWTFTPDDDGQYLFDTFLSPDGTDSVLVLFTGTAVNALTMVAFDDEDTSGINESKAGLYTLLSAGTTYRLQATPYNNGTADSIVLQVTRLLKLGPMTTTVLNVPVTGISGVEGQPAGVPPVNTFGTTVWSDGSDSSYTTSARVGSAIGPSPVGVPEALTGVDLTEVRQVRIRVRASAHVPVTSSPLIGSTVNVFLQDIASSANLVVPRVPEDFYVGVPLGGAIYEYVVPVTAPLPPGVHTDAQDPVNLATLLRDHTVKLMAQYQRNANYSSGEYMDMRIYSLQLLVDSAPSLGGLPVDVIMQGELLTQVEAGGS